MKRHIPSWSIVLSALWLACSDGDPGQPGEPGEPGGPGDPGDPGGEGSVDDTPPGAPPALRIVGSPDGPPSFELRWNAPASAVAVGSFVVYEAATSFSSPDQAQVVAIEPEPARAATVALQVGTGVRHFRVQAVSFTGVASALSDEIIVDTTSRFVFIADRQTDEVFELWSVVPGTGAQPIKLSGALVANGDVERLFLSPDGRHAVFAADKDTDAVIELYAVPLDGSAAPTKISGTPVAGGAAQPFFAQFSPDGTRVAFVGDLEVDEQLDVYIADVAGTSRIRVSGVPVSGGDVDFDEFDWSPDGTRIAFIADKEIDNTFELFVGPADGSAEPTKVSGTLVAGGVVDGFAWRPDGRQLAIRSARDVLNVRQLDLASPDGGEPVNISGTLIPGGEVNADPVWSPDGKYIGMPGDLQTNAIFELFVISPENPGVFSKVSGTSLVTSDIVNFQWSPDSTRLAFNMDLSADNADEVFVGNAGGGGEPLRVSGAHAVDEEAFNVQWSPTGDRVAWFSDVALDNRFELFTADPTRFASQVTVSGALGAANEVFQYAWAPDGNQLAVIGDLTTDGVSEAYVANPLGGTPVRISGTMVAGGGVNPSFFGFSRLSN